MSFVLKAKHWQVFLILFPGIFLGSYFEVDLQSPLLLLEITLIVVWLLWLGYELNTRSPRKQRFWPALLAGLFIETVVLKVVDLVLLWMWPLGIWFLQPRINLLASLPVLPRPSGRG